MRGLALAAVLLGSALAGCDPAPLLVQTGSVAPAFALPRLEGGTAAFPADYGGRVVAIRFWADWCPYCRSEMQALEPLYPDLRERGLTPLAVNVMQPRDQVETFVRQVGTTAEVLLDADGGVTRSYGVMGLPVTVVVDRAGIVRGRIVGESPPETFVQVVEPLLQPEEAESR
ncbi:MAG: TlpA family protein disulfide reductase [Gammaproteobacteria bacterium]|nr:TlpA family protein disulfide reductase [Gammaproteobacteria bacterium]